MLEKDSVSEVTIVYSDDEDEVGNEAVLSVSIGYFRISEPDHIQDTVMKLDTSQLRDRFCFRIKEEMKKNTS